MNKKISFFIMGICLVGLVSAVLVSYLSNVVSASVNVSPPVFYLDSTDIIGDESYSLKLNDNEVSGDYFELQSGDIDSKEFFSESLGVDSFYEQDFKIYLNTEIYGLNASIEESGGLFVAMFITEEDGSVKETLCNNILIGITEDKIYEINCEVNGDGMDNLETTDRIKLLINDGSSSEVSMRIYLEDSKIEIIPK